MNARSRAAFAAFCLLLTAVQFSGCAKIADNLMAATRPEKYDIVFFFKKGISEQLKSNYLKNELSTVIEGGEATSTHPLIGSVEIFEFRGHTAVAIHYREGAPTDQTGELMGKLYYSETVFRVYSNAARSELDDAWEWSDKEGQ